MNQFMVNDFVITSNSLLINDVNSEHSAMCAQSQTRNNQVWNEELVLTNIMRNNHRLSCESRVPGTVRRPALMRVIEN